MSKKIVFVKKSQEFAFKYREVPLSAIADL